MKKCFHIAILRMKGNASDVLKTVSQILLFSSVFLVKFALHVDRSNAIKCDQMRRVSHPLIDTKLPRFDENGRSTFNAVTRFSIYHLTHVMLLSPLLCCKSNSWNRPILFRHPIQYTRSFQYMLMWLVPKPRAIYSAMCYGL